MLSKFERQSQNYVQSAVVEQSYSKKNVGLLISSITHSAGQVKSETFSVKVGYCATAAELRDLRHRLRLHHFLDVLHEEKDGDLLVSITLRKQNRK